MLTRTIQKRRDGVFIWSDTKERCRPFDEELMPKHKPFKFYCYFCGANEHEIRLVCSPAGVAICSNCIAGAAAELARTSKETRLINLVKDDK